MYLTRRDSKLKLLVYVDQRVITFLHASFLNALIRVINADEPQPANPSSTHIPAGHHILPQRTQFPHSSQPPGFSQIPPWFHDRGFYRPPVDWNNMPIPPPQGRQSGSPFYPTLFPPPFLPPPFHLPFPMPYASHSMDRRTEYPVAPMLPPLIMQPPLVGHSLPPWMMHGAGAHGAASAVNSRSSTAHPNRTNSGLL